MRHFPHRIAIAGLVLLSTQTGFAQYFGEHVMEKSFEHTDFYFTPYRFVPFGIGAFKNSAPGMLNDPFLELDVNPARLYRDTAGAGYLTIDFRNARRVADNRDVYYPYPMMDAARSAAYLIPYPQYFLRTRRELEPAVSLAYLVRPRSEAFNAFSFGATYQLITQDERYYAIPQDSTSRPSEPTTGESVRPGRRIFRSSTNSAGRTRCIRRGTSDRSSRGST
jgi:hypothetical protein